MLVTPTRACLAMLGISSLVLSSPPDHNPTSPNPSAARRNAVRIFNAVHSAARQWGSSLDHNGMSFFRATVPAGSVFYHGGRTPERPATFEWLAFEVEHAQNFAASWEPLPGSPRFLGHDKWDPSGVENVGFLNPETQKPLRDDDKPPPGPRPPPPPPFDRTPRRGYLQTYRAARPLNLVYVDGMAAGNSWYGTMDSQDYILRGIDPRAEPGPGEGIFDERDRARAFCRLADDWERTGGPRVDGFMRMEAGFEIIYCRFGDGQGLELVDVAASPFFNETGWVDPETRLFEWMRACSFRYDGFPRGRVELDWSTMVSAFFYDVNLTNPDAAMQVLPRIVEPTQSERAAIKASVVEMVTRMQQGRTTSIDWQGIVDMVVTRYSDRLALLASGNLNTEEMRSQVNFLLSPFLDLESSDPTPSLGRCKARYLESAETDKHTWTLTDSLIHTAIEAVSEKICMALVDVWEVLGGQRQGDPAGIVRDLAAELAWKTWKQCGRCESAEQICFVAMFPIGKVEDHDAPRCKNKTEIRPWDQKDGYWRHSRPSVGVY